MSSSRSIIVEVVREKDWKNVVKLLRSPDAYYHATQLYPLHEDRRRQIRRGTKNDNSEMDEDVDVYSDVDGNGGAEDDPSSVLAGMVSSSPTTSPPKAPIKEEYVPLINMCTEYEEVSLLLLELDPESVSIFVSPETGDTCLHTACKHASNLSVKTLDKMLSIAPSALIHANKDNEMPFHCALANGGSLDIVQMVSIHPILSYCILSSPILSYPIISYHIISITSIITIFISNIM